MRLTRIENVDLKRFEFDLDLTFAVFFLDSEGGIYGRYGGRDAESAERRQSLPGLQHAMQAALERHRERRGPAPVLRARRDVSPFQFVRQFPTERRRGACFHCHEVKEVITDHLRAQGQWQREMAWRYPLPDLLGLMLEVDTGDRIAAVVEGSPAEAAGLRRGDELLELGGAIVESLADAQYGLDHAPWEGETEVVWKRGSESKLRRAHIKLPAGWKQSNLLWRASMVDWVPVLDLDGAALADAERHTLGLAPNTLAFKIEGLIPPDLHDAGVRAGDVIIGIGHEAAGNLDSEGIDAWVGSRYQRGDKMPVRVIRDGENIDFTARF